MAADTERENRLDEIIASYLRAVQDGSAPTREALLDSHPDLADDLADFFADQERVRRLAAPLRSASDTAVLPRFRDFGDYEILGEIARGGMGVVFRARQKGLNRTVALKMLLAGPLASPDELRRFKAEAEAAARLDHPNIVPIHDVGVHDGHPYLSMRLLPGGSLARPDARPVAPREAARLLAAVADAVHFAHQRGVLHRDLKPANILLDERGQPYVSDFGLAKRTQPGPVPDPGFDSGTGTGRGTGGRTGTEIFAPATHTGAVVGTPAYMPPEQARGDRDAVTVAADVYGLGAVLYELLTGRAPFRGASPVETLRLVLETEPQRPRALNPAVERDLETICLKCLAKEAGRRYAAAADLAADLRRFLAGEPIQARRAGRAERLARSIRRHPVVSILTLALVLTLALGFITAVTLWLRAEVNYQTAQYNAGQLRLRDDALAAANQKLEGEKQTAEAKTREAEEKTREVGEQKKISDANLHRAIDALKDIKKLSDDLGKVPGNQAVRRRLLQTVLDYEQEFARQTDDPKLRRERADAQFDSGMILSEIGSNAEALVAYRRAQDLYRELHEADPEDTFLQRCYVNSFNNAATHEQDIESSLSDFREARRLYEEFLCFHPDDEGLLDGLGNTLNNLGAACLNSGRYAEALDYLTQAKEIQQGLFKKDEHRIAFTNDLASTCANLGTLYSRMPGKLYEARTNYDQSQDLYGRLARWAPNDPVRQANYAASLNAVGLLLRDHGDPDEGLKLLLEAEEERDKVAKAFPAVGRYQVDLALSYSNIGVAFARKGDRKQSLACHEQARNILNDLHKQDPKSAVVRRNLGSEWYNISASESALGRPSDEYQALVQARAFQEGLLADDPDNYDCRCDLGRTMINLGLAALRLKGPDEARAVLRAGIASLQQGIERSPQTAGELRNLMNSEYVNLSAAERSAGRPDDAVAVTLERLARCAPEADELYRGALELAATLPLYGRGKAEPPPAERAARDRCADLAVEALRRAAAAGFRDLDRLNRDREFDPLRQRQDFRAVIDGLQKNNTKPEASAGPGSAGG
jgi:serine/threonine-protein kinase